MEEKPECQPERAGRLLLRPGEKMAPRRDFLASGRLRLWDCYQYTEFEEDLQRRISSLPGGRNPGDPPGRQGKALPHPDGLRLLRTPPFSFFVPFGKETVPPASCILTPFRIYGTFKPRSLFIKEPDQSGRPFPGNKPYGQAGRLPGGKIRVID